MVPPAVNDASRFAGTTRESDLDEYIDPSAPAEELDIAQPKTAAPASVPTTIATPTSGYISGWVFIIEQRNSRETLFRKQILTLQLIRGIFFESILWNELGITNHLFIGAHI